VIPAGFTDGAVERAEAARRRSREAADAVIRVRTRIGQEPADPQARLARARAELQRALERSEAAHLDAAHLYDAVGQVAQAERHRAEARSDAARRARLVEA
jgi:hypothetical protein